MTRDAGVLLPLLGLPLVGMAVVRSRDPWKALALRSALGGFATLLFAAYGAADVAMTEALVGTILSTILYAVAIRSTGRFRLVQSVDAPLTEERQRQLTTLLQPTGLELQLLGPNELQDDPLQIHAVLQPDGALLMRHPSLLSHLQKLDPDAVSVLRLELDPQRPLPPEEAHH